MENSFIQVKQISKSYRIRKKQRQFLGGIFSKNTVKAAVKNIDFSIEKGESVGFIGPNGAGKSTTIKMLSGILYPDEGEIWIDGKIPYRQRKEHVAKIGAVFGQKSQLMWDLPVMDSFELIKRIYKVEDSLYEKNLEKFTKMLSMEEFLFQPVRQLSLGQRMKADIVAALLHSPPIVFFDEPTIGLDVVAKESIRNFIRYMNENENVTVLFTTHDMQDIEKTCKRIIMIDKGEIIFDGAIEQIRSMFGHSRKINLLLEEAANVADIEGIEIIRDEQDPKKVQMLFDVSHISMDELLSKLLKEYKIKDITIAEPDIEDIIRTFYREGNHHGLYSTCKE